jgi:hypothetical protein
MDDHCDLELVGWQFTGEPASEAREKTELSTGSPGRAADDEPLSGSHPERSSVAMASRQAGDQSVIGRVAGDEKVHVSCLRIEKSGLVWMRQHDGRCRNRRVTPGVPDRSRHLTSASHARGLAEPGPVRRYEQRASELLEASVLCRADRQVEDGCTCLPPGQYPRADFPEQGTGLFVVDRGGRVLNGEKDMHAWIVGEDLLKEVE